jgi:PHD/YefM family antitoxin component YafN of YafNO toxin-antitoxin module
MSDEKKPYVKITSLAEYKHDNLEEEWYVIAPTLDEARILADQIGMPDNRKTQVVYLTERQYEQIPEAH